MQFASSIKMESMNSMQSSDFSLNSAVQVDEGIEDIATSITAVKAYNSDVSHQDNVVHEITSKTFTEFLFDAIKEIKLQRVIDLLSVSQGNPQTIREWAVDFLKGDVDAIKPNITAKGKDYVMGLVQDVMPECNLVKCMDELHVIFVCVDVDKARRYCEMVGFLEILFSKCSAVSVSDFINRYTRIVAVENEAGVEGLLKVYIGEQGYDGLSATGAALSMIVFLGHGEQDGLELANGQYMKLDAIVDLTHQLFYDAVIASKSPGACELVFTQCYGHLYDQTQKSFFSGEPYSECFHGVSPSGIGCNNPATQPGQETCHRFGVVHFTRPGAELTYSTDYPNLNFPYQWKHLDANRYAQANASFIKDLVEYRPKANLPGVKFTILSVEMNAGSSFDEHSSTS